MVTWQEGANCFVEALADKNSVPGGGSAAAYTAAMGGALLLMSVGVTIKRKATPQADKYFLTPYIDEITKYKNDFKNLTAEDSAAYLEVINLKKQIPVDETKLAKAQIKAAEIPLITAQKAEELLKIIDEVECKIAKIILSDALCARVLLMASLKCCAENIRANLPYIKDENLKNKLKIACNKIDDLCRQK